MALPLWFGGPPDTADPSGGNSPGDGTPRRSRARESIEGSTAERDDALIQRIAKNDARAFELLVERYLEPLLNYAFRIVQSREAAEDVVQDVFGWIWDHRGSLKVQGTVQGYLFQAVRNRALNHQRDARTMAQAESNYASDESIGVLSRSPAIPDTALEQTDLTTALHRAIDELPSRRRHIVLLRTRRFSYAEIAEMMGVSVKTVEGQITRAFETLRERLRPWVR